MNKQAILGIIRHILTFGGGFMTQNGLASGEEVTTGVSAAVTLVLAADGSPAAKLQLERLSGRLQIERKRNI